MNPLDERFLDELLRETYHPTNIEPVIQKALAQCDHLGGRGSRRAVNETEIIPTKIASSVRRRWMSAIVTIIAASIVICLLAVLPSESSATETLREVIAGTEARVDREYHIETTGRVKLKAVLWVNGGDRFTLRLPALIPALDQYVWVGSNGTDFWIAPALGPVLINRQADWLLAQLQRQQQLVLPLLHLSTVTRRLESRYTTPRLVNDMPGMKHLVTEQKTPTTDFLPARVEIIARSGIIQELLLHWNPKHPGEEPFDMKLTLHQQNPMPGDWYEHNAHHAANRLVLPAQEDNKP
ncbi:MAG TPA: hypothetical protein PLN21_22425 [Gemmatales bacterium]|nr:hypothetical protein [Gemmatales bacterium]